MLNIFLDNCTRGRYPAINWYFLHINKLNNYYLTGTHCPHNFDKYVQLQKMASDIFMFGSIMFGRYYTKPCTPTKCLLLLVTLILAMANNALGLLVKSVDSSRTRWKKT